MRKRVLQYEGLAERIVETLVVAINEIPNDVYLGTLVESGNPFAVSSSLKLLFVQGEMLALTDGDRGLDTLERDEILLRLLKSFLADPGPERSEDELRTFLYRWLIPLIEEKLRLSPGSRR